MLVTSDLDDDPENYLIHHHIIITNVTTLCLEKKRHWCCRLYLQRTSTDFGSFWQKCRWESMLLNG